jgi:hypothetical protein
MTEPKPSRIAGVPVDAFVKGGTTSSRWDANKKRFYSETEARRAHQDKQRAAAAWSAGRPGSRGALMSLQLSGPGNPKVCLTYKAKDSALDRQCICEVAFHEGDKMILALVCPRCLERTQRMDDSQVIVRSEHREFWLDSSRAGAWVDPNSGLAYQLAGTVTTRDLLKCSALGCDWAFRIEDSILYSNIHFQL